MKEARSRITQLSRTIKDLPLANNFEKEVDFAMADLDLELAELAKIRSLPGTPIGAISKKENLASSIKTIK